MVKYNVGVGDAFPAGDENPRRDDRERDERDDRRERGDWTNDSRRWGCRERSSYRSWPFRVAFLLFAIWAVIGLFAHGPAPNGLLIPVGILVAIGISNYLFTPRRRRRRWEER